jgi:hypothetical protein
MTTQENGQVLDALNFRYDPEASREKTLYWLRKAIIATCRKKGVSAKLAEEIATRNVDQVLDQIANSATEVAPEPEGNSVIDANAEVIKGIPVDD